MKVKEIMNPVIKINSKLTVAEAAREMGRKNIGSMLIEEKDSIVGIITERDILKKIVAEGRDPQETSVKDIWTGSLITVSPEESIQWANELMIENNIRRMPVEQDGKIVGIFTMRDISKSLRYSLGKTLRNQVTGHRQ